MFQSVATLCRFLIPKVYLLPPKASEDFLTEDKDSAVLLPSAVDLLSSLADNVLWADLTCIEKAN